MWNCATMSFIRTCSEISEDSSAQISHRGVPLMQTTSGPSLNCHFSPHSAPTCNPHSVLSSPQQPPQISAQTPSSSRWAPWSSRSRCWNSWTPATTGGRRGSSGVTWPASGAPTGRRSLRSTTTYIGSASTGCTHSARTSKCWCFLGTTWISSSERESSRTK